MESTCHEEEKWLISEGIERRVLTGSPKNAYSSREGGATLFDAGESSVKGCSPVPPTLRFGVFEFDSRAGELRKKGMKVRLQGQPVEILTLLLEHPGETVAREELQRKLWPADTFVDFEQGLNNAMKRLRAALDDDAETPRYVETLPRRGYRFIGMLNGAGRTAGLEAAPAHRVGIRGPLALLTLVSLLALTVVLLALNVHGWRNRIFAHRPKPQIQALAVLPLANLSGDPEQEYFADGITDALITELGRISSPARVISRQSIMQYKGSKKSLNEIAAELKVDAVLEGTVARSGDQVRVSVRLNRVSPEAQLWSEEYTSVIRDVLRLEDQIARVVANEIQIKLIPQDRLLLGGAHTVNPDAYDDYLRGQFFLYQDLEEGRVEEGTKRNLKTAIGYFRQAVEKDPDFALAYAGLANSYIALGTEYRGGDYPRDTFPQAKIAAAKALELDPSLAQAHFSLAQVLELYDWNWSEADKEYRLALKLDPNYAVAHLEYGRYLQALGRNDEAMTQVNYALALDPFDYMTKDVAAWVIWATRQYDLAIKEFETLGDDLGLEAAYREKKMYPEAIAAGQRTLSRSRRKSFELGNLACVYGLAGKKQEALKLIEELKERARQRHISGFTFAHAYLGLGEKDQALTWLERAYEDRELMVFIKAYPLWDALRSEPRFQALLRRMNFPQ